MAFIQDNIHNDEKRLHGLTENFATAFLQVL